MYSYSASVLSVVDGDTLHVELDLGLDVRVRTTLRLNGIDCPELKTPAGKAAKAFTEAWVKNNGGVVVVDTYKDKREKYGRYLAEVRPTVPPYVLSLNQSLLVNGHAKPYDGGKRG